MQFGKVARTIGFILATLFFVVGIAPSSSLAQSPDPPPTENLRVVARLVQGHIELKWDAPSSQLPTGWTLRNYQIYRVERRLIESLLTEDDVPVRPIAIIDPNDQVYIDEDVDRVESYYYWVSARYVDDNSTTQHSVKTGPVTVSMGPRHYLAGDNSPENGNQPVVKVPHNWSLIPEGQGRIGDRFRLLSVSYGYYRCASRTIREVNRLIQRDLSHSGHQHIQPYAEHFRAIGSTTHVDARDNIAVENGDEIPIYWLNGERVATGTDDLFDGEWENEDKATVSTGREWHPENPFILAGRGVVLTGTSRNGYAANHNLSYNRNVVRTLDSGKEQNMGILNRTRTQGPIGTQDHLTCRPVYPTMRFPMYAISPVFEVEAGSIPVAKVPPEWPAIPAGMGPRDQFRLLFVTSEKMEPAYQDINEYNTFVQKMARSGDKTIRQFHRGFRAVGATRHYSAVINTDADSSPEKPGVPIYWLCGNRVADDYVEFWAGSWDDQEHPTDESCEVMSLSSLSDGIATGASKRKGGIGTGPLGGSESDGDADVDVGKLNDPSDGVFAIGARVSQSEPRPYYGLSQIFEVSDPPVVRIVQPDWSLIPEGLEEGDSFRLLFVTSTRHQASSDKIQDYNRMVQGRAEMGHTDLLPYSRDFRVVGSTRNVHALDNTHASPDNPGAPIYWVNGGKVADDYTEFWMGSFDGDRLRNNSWDEEAEGRDEYGKVTSFPVSETSSVMTDDNREMSARGIWTGTGYHGRGLAVIHDQCVPTPDDCRSRKRTFVHYTLGETRVGLGRPNEAGGPVNGRTQTHSNQHELPLYGLSLVFKVGARTSGLSVVEYETAALVPPGWALVPEGVKVGERFRLLFVTSTSRDATATAIGDYNNFVQERAAAGHDDVRAFSPEFRAAVSTADTDARDNTGAIVFSGYPGVPIYWLDGDRAAKDYLEFFSNSWNEEAAGRDESGAELTLSEDDTVWTGSGRDGREHTSKDDQGDNVAHGLGTSTPVLGDPNDHTEGHGPLHSGLTAANTEERPLYALSKVFEVGHPSHYVPTTASNLTATPPTDCPVGKAIELNWDMPSTDADGDDLIPESQQEVLVSYDNGRTWEVAEAVREEEITEDEETAEDNVSFSFPVGEKLAGRTLLFRVAVSNIYGDGPSAEAAAVVPNLDDCNKVETLLSATVTVTSGTSVYAGSVGYQGGDSSVYPNSEITDSTFTYVGAEFSLGLIAYSSEYDVFIIGLSPTTDPYAHEFEKLKVRVAQETVSLHSRFISGEQLFLPMALSEPFVNGDEIELEITKGGLQTLHFSLPDDTAPSLADMVISVERYDTDMPSLRFKYVWNEGLDLNLRYGNPRWAVFPEGVGVVKLNVGHDIDRWCRRDEVTCPDTMSEFTFRLVPCEECGYRLLDATTSTSVTTLTTLTTLTMVTPPPPPPPELAVRAVPLTAEFVPDSIPDHHLGPGKTFQVRVSFSEPVATDPDTLGGRGISVREGTLRGVSRANDSGDVWEINVEPASDQPVTVGLLPTTDCAAASAICTAAGQGQSSNISKMILGPPELPASPRDLAGALSGENIVLTWQAPAGSVVTEYRVYRSELPDGEPVLHATLTADALTYTDAEVELGTQYQYRVAAANITGVGTKSDPVSATTPDPLPAAPANLDGALQEAKIVLTWDAPLGSVVTAYSVYRRLVPDGGLRRYASIPADGAALSYDDTGIEEGAEYLYRVSANNDTGEGPLSPAVSIAVPGNLPGIPQNLAGTSSAKGIELTWDAPVNSRVTEYKVYRRVLPNGAWSAHSTVPSSSEEITYTDREVEPGTEYEYRISATNTVGEGAQSAPVSVANAQIVLGRPRDLRGGSDGNIILIYWSAPAGATPDGYRIYRRSLPSRILSAYADIPANADSDVQEYYDTDVEPGLQYLYRVAGVNSAGVGPKSSPVWITVPGQRLEAPADLAAVYTERGMEVTWVAPTNAGITDYQVYRGKFRGDGGAFDGQASKYVLIPAESDPMTYVDTDVERGAAYRYRVAAVNATGEGFKTTWLDVRAAISETDINSTATGAPTISGTARVGETLTADVTGIADGDGMTSAIFSYQWLADDVNIAGATGSSYTLAEGEQGKTIMVRVSFTDDGNYDETLTSTPTAAVAPRANSSATGAPTISGTARVGETLTADVTGIADGDGMTSAIFSYQWLADDVNIAGATGSSYTLAEGEQGKTIMVRVSFTDDGNYDETLTSTPTAAVAPRANSSATGAPTISGTARVGETLTADVTGIADGDGMTSAIFSYQWLADDVNIAGATGSSYTLAEGEQGKTIMVRVSFTDDGNYDETLTSTPTAAVAPRPNSSATGAPTISGTARVGETLTADVTGIADGDGMTSAIFSYQWLADDVNIAGATGSSYTLAEGEQGKTIMVRVSFTDDGNYDETLTSTPTAAVAPRANSSATGAPTISGTARVGETLTADVTGIADGDGMTSAIFSYQWLADDVNIAGATGSSYTLAEGEQGKTIMVRVSFTDDGNYDETLTSTPTAAVAPRANSSATGAPTISGTARVGETLTADVTGIADGDGMTSAIFSYQWLADDVNIAGATGSSYTLAEGEQGKTIMVRVSFTDDGNYDETLTSTPTAAVAPLLTASLHGVPESRDGSSEFTFELKFSAGPLLHGGWRHRLPRRDSWMRTRTSGGRYTYSRARMTT